MGVNPYNLTRQSWTLSLSLLLLSAGPGGLICEDVIAESYNRPIVKISFEWKSEYYIDAKADNYLEFTSVEQLIKEQVKLEAEKKYRFIDWSGESSVNGAVNEWIVELERYKEVDNGEVMGWDVYLNQYFRINGQSALLTGNEKTGSPIANSHSGIPYWAGRPPKSMKKLRRKLLRYVNGQLPILFNLEEVTGELKAIPVADSVNLAILDKDQVSIPVSLCDIGVNQHKGADTGAEFIVVLKYPPLVGDTDSTPQSFKFREYGGPSEEGDIKGFVSWLGITNHLDSKKPFKDGWVEGLRQKAAESTSQVVTLHDYASRQQDCGKINSGGLATSPTEPVATS
jgi:hypothetical protein